MLFWIFALLLLGSVAVVGFNMGAIRAAISFVGLIFSALLAFPIGHFLGPVFSLFGFKNPVAIWALGPLLAFLVILILFKVAAMTVHQKIDVYYKYKVGELRLAIWERMNHRLGLSVGLANGAIYLILLSMPVYVLSYATIQLEADDSAPWTSRMLNFLGTQLEASGMATIAASIDPMPESYYDAVDIVALIYHNDLLEGRLSRYPGFLSLGERPEFQAIAADTAFTELRMKQPAFGTILDQPSAQAITGNSDLLKAIWETAAPDLKDLQAFLKTGVSAKYDRIAILGRWTYDLRGSLSLLRRANPNFSVADMRPRQDYMAAAFTKMTFVAAPDKTAVIKNLGTPPKPVVRPPNAKGPPPAPLPTEYQNITGHWESAGDNKYQLSVGTLGTLDAVVEGDFLSVTGGQYPFRFSRD